MTLMTQADLVKTIWPDRITLTSETLANAVSAGLDLRWFAEEVLSEQAHSDYLVQIAPLYADYLAEVAPLNADYEAKRAPLNADYLAKGGPVSAGDLAKRETLYAAYQAKVGPLGDRLQARRDALLIAALLAAGGQSCP